MHWLRTTIIFLILALIQSTFMTRLAVAGTRPDLLLALAVIIVSRRPAELDAWQSRAFWIGWLAGLAIDIFSPGGVIPFGVIPLVYGLAIWGAGELAVGLVVETFAAQITFLIPICLAAHAALAVILSLIAPGPLSPLIRQIIGVTVYTIIVSPLLYYLVTRFQSFFGVRARRELDV